jgi:hypothetical protein
MIEIRNLMFMDAELIEALTPLMRKRGDQIPGPQPLKLRKKFETGYKLTLEIDFTYDFQTRQFSGEEILASMVAFCISRKVPLPRLGSKEVDIRGDYVALIVRSDVDTSRAQKAA